MKKIISLLILFALLSGSIALAQAKPKPQPEARQQEEAKIKKMALKEAIFYALKNNLDLQIQVIDTENAWNSLRISDSIFVPNLNINFNNRETNTPASGFLDGAEINKSENLSLDLTLTQKLALGGDLNITLSNNRYESNSAWSNVNPAINSSLTFSLNQPLLKGFGTLATKRDIYISANNLKISKYRLKQQVMELVYQVENAYWNLVYAYQSLDTWKMSLKRSQDLLKQNRIKVKVGAAARIDILDAEAGVASDESSLLVADQTIQDAEEDLKKILNMSTLEQTITPTDRPEVKKIEADLNAFLLEALENRPDVHQAKLELKNYKIDVKYYRNQMLPDLQLTAQYWTTGQGGDKLIFAPTTSIFDPRIVIGVVEKDVWASMKDVFSNLFKNYSIGLSLNVPLSNKRERAELARAKLNLKSAFLKLKNTENTVYSEVKKAIKSLESNLKLVEARKISMKLEDRKLKAEEKKLSVGLVSNYDVIQKQRDFINAQTNHLGALRDYSMTIADITKKLARTFTIYDIKFSDLSKK